MQLERQASVSSHSISACVLKKRSFKNALRDATGGSCFFELVGNACVNATCGDLLFGRNKNVCIVLCCDRACGLSVGGMGGPDRQETEGLTMKLSG